jgi:hypothetical protein
MNFASLRLVLHSTSVAAKAIQALSSHALFPHGDLVVKSSLRSLTKTFRAVDRSMSMRPPPPSATPPQYSCSLIFSPSEDRRSRDPALVAQEINGCKTLLLEVIRRAAYDWVLYRTSRRLLHKKLAEDAYLWLFVEKPGHVNWLERNDAGKHITSFLSICSELDLDVEQVRMYVRRLTIKNVMSVGRPAEYRRREPCLSSDEDNIPSLSAGTWNSLNEDRFDD